MQTSLLNNGSNLMVGKKVLYVHGFMSSAQSGTVHLLKELMPQAEIIAEDLPLHPQEALDMLRELCKSEQPDLIIGTSMGGMFTEMLYGYDRIVVNPAFKMGETMSKHGHMGKQVFQNPRKDGVQEFIVTKALVKEFDEVTAQCFAQVTSDEQQRVYGLFGDEDEFVSCSDLFEQHYTNSISFHGGHRLTDKVALHSLLPVIRWIDNKQEQREPPVVYISYETLLDSYAKPKSSLMKAYEMLLANYNVVIVAPSAPYHPEITAEKQQWIEQYLSVPAYKHVAFCDDISLLYGDYLITTNEDAPFLGTVITFGSDEFKSWEDMIVYFSRLGGQ